MDGRHRELAYFGSRIVKRRLQRWWYDGRTEKIQAIYSNATTMLSC